MITNDKFLAYAKRIISKRSIPEEESRSAISRAYYSLYHETLEIAVRRYSFYLIRNIEKFRRPRKKLSRDEKYQLNALDSKFLRKFNLHGILTKTLLDIGEQVLSISFKDVRDKRNQADYDLKMTFTHNEASTIVDNVDSLVGQVKLL